MSFDHKVRDLRFLLLFISSSGVGGYLAYGLGRKAYGMIRYLQYFLGFWVDGFYTLDTTYLDMYFRVARVL